MKYKRYIIVYAVFAILVLLDIVTKIVTDGIDMEIIGGVLSFESHYNKGAAWSIFSDFTVILAILSFLFVVFAVIFDLKTKIKKTKLYNISFVMILAGAFGNAIDRIFLGYVRDFVKLDFINFPVFNLADSLLVVGVIILGLYIITYKENENQNKKTINEDSKESNDVQGLAQLKNDNETFEEKND